MPPSVWIVNADHWPRAYLRAELLERGYDATGFEDVREAMVRLGSRAPRPALLVIEARTGEIPSGPRRLCAARGIPILAIVGAAADTRELAPEIEPVRRPVTIGAIADAVERRVARARPERTAEPGR